MLNTKFLFSVAIAISFLSSVTAGSSQITKTYLEILGKDKEFLSRWEITQLKENIQIISGNTLLDHVYIKTKDGSTIEWRNSRKHQDMSFTALRKNNSIHINGIKKGEAFEKTLSITDDPWYQTPGFLLQPFALSPKQSEQFIMLRASTLNPILLEITKIGTESLTLDHIEYETIKTQLAPVGFLSLFWKAPMWFDSRTGQILKYDGLIGGPGSDSFKIIYKNKTE